ncbi:MAG: ATP-binding protein, partial [Mycolicibacterium vanbaalenii]
MTDSVTERLDYLQRCGDLPHAPAPPLTGGEPEARRLLRVSAIGRPTRDPRSAPPPDRERWRAPTTELITGFYGYRIPLAYLLRSTPDGSAVCIGTWPTTSSVDRARQDTRIGIAESVLRGLYPIVECAPVSTTTPEFSRGGVAFGVPAPAGVDDRDGAAAIDRVIRSMIGASWAVLILAQPASERAVAAYREMLLNEMRLVLSAAKNEAAPSPLSEHYVELLKVALAAAGDGMASGAWRTGVYLLGDHDSYPRLATAWRSVMSGPKSLPEPVRTAELDNAADLANRWVLSNTMAPGGPGSYQRPFQYQTLLSTQQLAAC